MLMSKLAVLVALTQASQFHSISLLAIEGMLKDDNSYTMFYSSLLKHCRNGKRNPIVKFKKYVLDERICVPVYTSLEEYLR